MKRILLLMVLLLANLFCSSNLWAQNSLGQDDVSQIRVIMQRFSDAFIRKDANEIFSMLSPSMSPETTEKIKVALDDEFVKYDYTKYRIFGPSLKDIKIIAPNKVEFKVSVSKEYEGETQGSSSGFKTKFVMERVGAKWLILDSDFYTTSGIWFVFAMVGVVFVFFAIFVPLIAFWIWMLVDCIKRDFKDSNEKVVWVLVLIFLQLIGAIVYYFVVKRKKTTP
ncbi:MAG: PLD nuclease N-terminal domain-containing protein [Pseudomonadota bacterium]